MWTGLFGPDFVPYAIPITPSPVYQPYYTTPVSPYPTASTCYAVEGWDRPNWWQDRQLSSSAAGNILKKRLEVFGPQSKIPYIAGSSHSNEEAVQTTV